ncbi:MAG: diguanylate cyclase [Pseudomonadales bacterium]
MDFSIKSWFSSSLTRETILKMGIRISFIVMAVTLLTYWHTYNTLEEQTYDNLQNYITERGQKESAIFTLAEDNHLVFRKAFLDAWPKALAQSSLTRFNSLFFEPGDDTRRLRSERFTGTHRFDGTISKHISGYVGGGSKLNEFYRSKLLLSYDLIDRYAEGWTHRFSTLYVTMPENAIMIHWPLLAWGLETDATLDINKEEWGYVSDPEHNPTREPAWTGLFYDVPAEHWMVSLKTPVELDGVPLVDVGHDILLNDVFERVVNDHLKGTYNFIFREDGRLIAHPEFFSNQELVGEAVAGRAFQISDLGDKNLENAAKLAVSASGTFEGVVLDDEVGDALLAVTRIKGPDWYFVTVYPKALISSTALDAAYFIFLLGLFSIVLEVLMLYLVLSKQVISPLGYFVKVANKITHGDFNIHMGPQSDRFLESPNEVGVLGRSLSEMAVTIQTNDERLEREVEQRTQDLNETNQALLGEIAVRRELEEKLREQINIDSLTGVYGRSYFLRLGDLEFKRSRREGTSLFAVMIDIDLFKNINDTYGHPAGDAVLKQFALICQECLREIDVFGRLGGEEFALVITGVNEREAFDICDRIRASLEKTEIVTEEGIIRLTASFGCASIESDDEKIDAILNRADKALYDAKGGGRNQVIMKVVG